ncbi:MAG: ribosome biogenesis GTP-binding protein YihA/YsxC [Zetaproteobacteria bacterium]|nr:ribosome biogenesis GTP-binding protein YihA/YsxC [Zetaproteobacteria bacterium]
MHSKYLISAQKASQLPEQTHLAEIAFVGRSNSGKSSLLNNLTGRRQLARTSSTPGRTQMINFFSVEKSKSEVLIFADLPGYGFNVASRSVQAHWSELMDAYFERSNLATILFLCDCRRKLDSFELEYLQYLSRKAQLGLVLTKVDKINKRDLAAQKKKFLETSSKNGIEFEAVYCVSNLKKQGVAELSRALFDAFVVTESETDLSEEP